MRWLEEPHLWLPKRFLTATINLEFEQVTFFERASDNFFFAERNWSNFRNTHRAVLLDPRDPLLQSEKGFAADPVYGRAKCLPVLGSLKTSRT